MINNDNDRLLQQFFREAAPREIADDGFTDRVMQRIVRHSALSPQPSALSPKHLSRLWTVFCVLVFAVLFVWLRGWDALAVHFEVMLRTMVAEPMSINLSMLFTVVFGLLFVGVGEVIASVHR